jgi:hypothetical protein
MWHCILELCRKRTITVDSVCLSIHCNNVVMYMRVDQWRVHVWKLCIETEIFIISRVYSFETNQGCAAAN